MATQTENRTNVYEGMFLFPQAVTSNLQKAVDHLKQILDRTSAEVLSFRKWDERKLAYEIDGNKRGVYFLVYFRAPAENMERFNRDCNLSEELLRSLVIRADHLTQEQIEAAEGRAALEDEIRLRGEQQEQAGEAAAGGSSVVESRTGREARLAGERSGSGSDDDESSDDETDDSDDREPAVAGAKDSE